MDKKNVGLIALALLTGGFFGTVVDSEKPIYVCDSLQLASDCVNGIKANGKWCYFNATNTKSYKVCAEGWKPMSDIVTLKSNSASEICYPINTGKGCVAA